MGQIGFLSLRERHECRFFVLFCSNTDSKGTKKMKKKETKKPLVVIIALSTAILVLVAACGLVGPVGPPLPEEEIQQEQPPLEQQPSLEQQPQEQETSVIEEEDLIPAQDIGEGAIRFNFLMFDGEDNALSWNVYTDETTVGAALLEVGLIDGEVSDFGLMVSHVNGIRADFNEDGAYWAFYIDYEFAMVGVDSTEIEEGVVYKFIYTEA